MNARLLIDCSNPMKVCELLGYRSYEDLATMIFVDINEFSPMSKIVLASIKRDVYSDLKDIYSLLWTRCVICILLTSIYCHEREVFPDLKNFCLLLWTQNAMCSLYPINFNLLSWTRCILWSWELLFIVMKAVRYLYPKNFSYCHERNVFSSFNNFELLTLTRCGLLTLITSFNVMNATCSLYLDNFHLLLWTQCVPLILLISIYCYERNVFFLPE